MMRRALLILVLVCGCERVLTTDCPSYQGKEVAPVTAEPSSLTGDYDGDGRPDRLVVLERQGALGLGILRQGACPEGIGFGDGLLRENLIAELEAWRLLSRDHGPLGYIGEPPWPDTDGDVVVLERIEKELWLLYRQGGYWQSQRVYRLVEP